MVLGMSVAYCRSQVSVSDCLRTLPGRFFNFLAYGPGSSSCVKCVMRFTSYSVVLLVTAAANVSNAPVARTAGTAVVVL